MTPRSCTILKQHPFRINSAILLSRQCKQSGPIVVVLDALDECSADDNEDGRALLETVADWANLPGRSKLVVTSRDIPDIRNVLVEVSYPICLTTGEMASIEDKSDMQEFFRVKFNSYALICAR